MRCYDDFEVWQLNRKIYQHSVDRDGQDLAASETAAEL